MCHIKHASLLLWLHTIISANAKPAQLTVTYANIKKELQVLEHIVSINIHPLKMVLAGKMPPANLLAIFG